MRVVVSLQTFWCSLSCDVSRHEAVVCIGCRHHDWRSAARPRAMRGSRRQQRPSYAAPGIKPLNMLEDRQLHYDVLAYLLDLHECNELLRLVW
jgi:hypothetical protein